MVALEWFGMVSCLGRVLELGPCLGRAWIILGVGTECLWYA